MKKPKKIQYEWNMLDNDCRELVSKLRKSKTEIRNIYGIPRGGLVPAVIISHLMDLPMIDQFDKIDNDTLVVDDISDTGQTLEDFLGDLKCPVVTLYIDRQTSFRPLFHCRMKESNEWIVFPFETIKSSKKDN